MANIQKTVALIAGVAFLLIGILGFVPAFAPNGALLGIFAVNPLHSIVHLLFGVLGLAAAFTGWPRLYNRAGGIVYLLLGVLGFFPGIMMGGMMLGMVSINLADNFLHLILGAVLAAVGFLLADSPVTARA